MVIDCLSVFLFSFGYLSVFVEENFLFCLLPSVMHSSISPFLIFHIFLFSVLFQNLPAPNPRGSSYTGRNSTYVISYTECMEELGEVEVDLSSSIFSPSLPGGTPERLALPFFVKLEKNGIFL